MEKSGDVYHKAESIFVTVNLIKGGKRINDFSSKKGDKVTLSGNLRPGEKGKVVAFLRVGEKAEIETSATLPDELSCGVPAISSGNYQLVVKDKQGRELKEISVSHCGDNKGQDLCLLSTSTHPKSWLSIKSSELTPGEKIYIIGHPQGFDYSISDGVISSIQTAEFGLRGSLNLVRTLVKYFRVSTPISGRPGVCF